MQKKVGLCQTQPRTQAILTPLSGFLSTKITLGASAGDIAHSLYADLRSMVFTIGLDGPDQCPTIRVPWLFKNLTIAKLKMEAALVFQTH